MGVGVLAQWGAVFLEVSLLFQVGNKYTPEGVMELGVSLPHTQDAAKWTLSWLHNHIMYCKVKVKVCVHVMKAYKVSSCRALLFLDLETRWRWVNFTPRPPYDDTKDQYPRNMRQDGPQKRSGRSGEDEISFTLPEFCFKYLPPQFVLSHIRHVFDKHNTWCLVIKFLLLAVFN